MSSGGGDTYDHQKNTWNLELQGWVLPIFGAVRAVRVLRKSRVVGDVFFGLVLHNWTVVWYQEIQWVLVTVEIAREYHENSMKTYGCQPQK